MQLTYRNHYAIVNRTMIALEYLCGQAISSVAEYGSPSEANQRPGVLRASKCVHKPFSFSSRRSDQILVLKAANLTGITTHLYVEARIKGKAQRTQTIKTVLSSWCETLPM